MTIAWTKHALGDVLAVVSGQVDPRSEPYRDLPHVGGENIESDTGRIFGVETARELGLVSGKYLFGDNDVLYSKIRPLLNKVALPAFAGICSADIYPLRPNPKHLSRRFLAYLLRSQGFMDYTSKHSSRTNIPRLNRDGLLSYEVALPPLPEQRRIAAILDKADDVRAKRRRALEQLNKLTPSVFVEMFGPLLANVPEHAVPLRDCAQVVSGVTKGRKFNGRATADVPYLRVANVQAGFLDLSEVKTIPALPHEIEALRLMPGDVVLTEGGDFDKLGRGAVWAGQIKNCIHQNHVFRVRFNQSVLPEYFHEYLLTPPARAYFLRCAKKTTNLASINMTQLRALPVVVPDVERQHEFVLRARAVSRLANTIDISLRSSETLFASLQQQAFAGAL